MSNNRFILVWLFLLAREETIKFIILCDHKQPSNYMIITKLPLQRLSSWHEPLLLYEDFGNSIEDGIENGVNYDLPLRTRIILANCSVFSNICWNNIQLKYNLCPFFSLQRLACMHNTKLHRFLGGRRLKLLTTEPWSLPRQPYQSLRPWTVWKMPHKMVKKNNADAHKWSEI